MTIKELLKENGRRIDIIEHFDNGGCNCHSWNEEAIEFVGLDFTLSGDYVGSTVEKSNRRYITETFESIEKYSEETDEDFKPWFDGEHWVELCLGHGAACVFIRSDLSIDSVPTDLISVIENINDYYVIDEDVMSEVEQEIIEESWQYYSGELESAAEKAALNILDCDGIHLEQSLSAYIQTHCFDMYYAYCERTGDYPRIDSYHGSGDDTAYYPNTEKVGEMIGEYFARRIVWC